MFPSKEFWLSAFFGAIGGIISVLFLKFLEDKVAALRETGGPDDKSKSQKSPQEHDERFY